MPNPRDTNRNRGMVSVQVNGYSARYGFYTNHNQTARNKFGHQNVTDTNGVVFGANLPKPPRATYKNTSGSYTSFFDWGKYNDLVADPGVKLTPGRFPIPRSSTNFTKYVYVEMKTGEGETGTTINYAWRMPNWLYTLIGSSRSSLKINDVDSSTTDLWFGIDNPKPKIATNPSQGATTYCGHDATFTEGTWFPSEGASKKSFFQ